VIDKRKLAALWTGAGGAGKVAKVDTVPGCFRGSGATPLGMGTLHFIVAEVQMACRPLGSFPVGNKKSGQKLLAPAYLRGSAGGDSSGVSLPTQQVLHFTEAKCWNRERGEIKSGQFCQAVFGGGLVWKLHLIP
jgi:hypothetical protein